MIVGIGCDLCDTERMEKLLGDGRFLKRYFAPEEQAYITDRGWMAASSMAAAFAAKEAFVKALGTGFQDISPADIVILHDKYGKPYYELRGQAAAHASQMNITCLHLSLSHENNMALAFAAAERNT